MKSKFVGVKIQRMCAAVLLALQSLALAQETESRNTMNTERQPRAPEPFAEAVSERTACSA
jgi:hypothetical protein